MNQEPNQTTSLLKAVLAVQILTLALMLFWIVGGFILNNSLRAEYNRQLDAYRARVAEHAKAEAAYQKGTADYKVLMENWQRENAAYTSGSSPPAKP